VAPLLSTGDRGKLRKDSKLSEICKINRENKMYIK
jgi:hypothetical protein